MTPAPRVQSRRELRPFSEKQARRAGQGLCLRIGVEGRQGLCLRNGVEGRRGRSQLLPHHRQLASEGLLCLTLAASRLELCSPPSPFCTRPLE